MVIQKILPLALLAVGASAIAQQLPSAGTQIQSIPPSPTPQRAAPGIRIEPGNEPAGTAAAGQKISVNRLEITGARAYSEAELLAVTGFTPGSQLGLADLQGMAQKITQHYRSAGHFVAQAVLPAQEIKDGVVRLTVLEGEYGNVTLRNQSRLDDGLVYSQLDGLGRGDPITLLPLESRLLRLSDIPGVAISSTLTPGTVAGTSDLLVDVVPGRTVSGSIDADNAGNRYTGRYRLGATLNLNGLAGRGDVASLRLLTSGSGLRYARASYQMQFGKATAGVAYSWLGYELGREFASLNASGEARIASIYGSYPLIRSRNTNLYALLGYDAKTFQDRVGTPTSVTDRKARALTAGLRGDHRDNIGLGGVTSYSIVGTAGNIDIQTPAVRAFDATTARTNGGYGKLGFSAMRLQSVSDRVSVYASINGQLASKNLDVSEKMQLGGINGVRAYPEGEAYADEGFLFALEARLQLPSFYQTMPGQMQLVGFIDTGSVTLNKNPWVAGNNRRTLSGAGIGLDWSVYNDFVVRTSYALKLGSGAATSAPDRSGRFWIQAVKYF